MSKKDLQEYLDFINQKIWALDVKMQEYIKKKTSDALKIEEGMFIVFEKPEIETNFYTGVGLDGIASSEEWAQAFKENKTECSFVTQNMNKNFSSHTENDTLYLNRVYSYKAEVTKQETSEIMPPEFKKEYLRILNEQKEKFLKRLKNYLKRYGLTKVKNHVYLID